MYLSKELIGHGPLYVGGIVGIEPPEWKFKNGRKYPASGFEYPIKKACSLVRAGLCNSDVDWFNR
jgi:hypothetical protein